MAATTRGLNHHHEGVISVSDTTVPLCVPACNPPQHMTALQRANTIRLRRAELRRQLRAGQTTIADAISDESCQTAPIGALLAYQSRWGTVRADRALRGICSPARTVAALTPRQRDLVIAVVSGELTYDPLHREFVTRREVLLRRAHLAFIAEPS